MTQTPDSRDPRLTEDPDGTLRYEGRPLAHADEPLADQGLAFDLGTLATRRAALAAFAAGGAALGLAACSASGSDGASDGGGEAAATTADGEIPEETNGPYPADGTNGITVLTESEVVRSDLTTSFGTGSATASGVPMTLSLTITDLSNDNAPYEGVAVYVWHCTADGLYSLYSEGLEEENFLRGVQVADGTGTVTFTSIMPGCYAGRWPHIHFEVYPDLESITSTDNLLATSQVAIPQDVCETVYATAGYDGSTENLAQITLDSDNVFGDDGGELQLATVEGDVNGGFTVALPVAIDPTTEPGTSGMGGGGAMGGGAPEGGGGPGGGEPPAGAPSDGGGEPPAADAQGALVGSALVASR
ncbi:intradiol ring-cleavage dioxygenase [Brachybacterium sp. J153]|uniref:intradiol ring-cleavage dioxygenase n=1 Tax=Brachybacterium sp. J153 TaxID=3116488 RepID=UPI002E7A7128|nr:intradiol ring-cleavage dioxygenase [Brachybacterium sp. J153]MEE1617474.1 intradiol ring-cleavage dioxygenase [Brachybacterium sp. J153]